MISSTVTGTVPASSAPLAEIGFFSEKDRYFKNASTQVYLEFPPGLVLIGNELAKAPQGAEPLVFR